VERIVYEVPRFESSRLSGATSRSLRQSYSKFFSEESSKVTRKFLLSILAVIPAVCLPLTATSQIAPDRPHKEQTEPTTSTKPPPAIATPA